MGEFGNNETVGNIRKWFAYIKERYGDEYPPPGYIMIYDSPLKATNKGEEHILKHMDSDTGRVVVTCKTIGLGYADFENEEDYENRVERVIEEKKKEVLASED